MPTTATMSPAIVAWPLHDFEGRYCGDTDGPIGSGAHQGRTACGSRTLPLFNRAASQSLRLGLAVAFVALILTLLAAPLPDPLLRAAVEPYLPTTTSPHAHRQSAAPARGPYQARCSIQSRATSWCRRSFATKPSTTRSSAPARGLSQTSGVNGSLATATEFAASRPEARAEPDIRVLLRTLGG